MKKTPKNVRETSVYFHCPYIIYRNVLIYIYRKCPLSNWRKSTRNIQNKCVKLEREICALRSLDNEWRSSIQRLKTIQTVRAVDALLLISISHNGNGQEAPPSGIFGSQQLVPHPQVACPRAKRHARECNREWSKSSIIWRWKRDDV